MSDDVLLLSRALVYAAEAHRNQRRKGAAQEPYINHLIEVMDLVAQSTDGADAELLVAALLHDAIEDCGVSHDALSEAWGERVARIVRQNSDDMTLPKAERRERRIAGMAEKPADARTVKIADVISNMRAVAISAPAGWTAERKLGYIAGCRALVDAGRGANDRLEALFDKTAAEVEAAIGGTDPDAQAQAVRHLDNVIGQAVHLIYLPNTRSRALSEADTARFAEVIATRFPSVTIQEAKAHFDGRFRPILMARLRSDDSDGVVSLAQQLCLEFDESFVGIEVGGRYIRVYSDDTG